MVVVRNLSSDDLKTSLIVMSPVSLLFSSDEEASRRVAQALTELELEIELCPDVFTAVEWLTSRSFDVIVADWDSGPEAAFLLKNARDLKLNRAAFTLALTSRTSNLAAEEDSPDLVLTKPLIPDQIKYAVLSNDRFLGCMKTWIARGDFAQGQRTPPSPSNPPSNPPSNEDRRAQPEQPSPTAPPARPLEPSPASGYRHGGGAPPLHLTFATLDRGLFRSSSQRSGEHVSGKVKRRRPNKFLCATFLSVVFVAIGCTFGQPLRVQSVFASVATAYEQALETSSRHQSPDSSLGLPSATPAAASQRSGSGRYPSRPRAVLAQPEQNPTPDAETIQADLRLDQDRGLDQDRAPTPESRVLIPESLKVPQPEAATVRPVSVKRSPSLLSQLEPVSLPEDLSQSLLVQKVQPSYPEQALKAGLQGAVVLQAWIDKDGSIRELKLVNGSLLLGQAAVQAVKQWRYKPYLRNGVAVEAETYVTVNFRLP
jgi:TonB family protein